jgi:hypothetical protein
MPADNLSAGLCFSAVCLCMFLALCRVYVASSERL